MARGALALSEENLLAADIALCGFGAIQTPGSHIQFRRGRKIEHILHLGHVADLNPIEDIHTLLDGVDLVPVEVCGALLKLGEVLHRTQAALGTVDLLIKKAAG